MQEVFQITINTVHPELLRSAPGPAQREGKGLREENN